MERRVIFHDGQDNDPQDYNNLQAFAQESLDHLVQDGLTADRRYAGFDAVANGAVQLTVQPGRIYSGGKVFAAKDVFTKDFTTQLPVATKKIVLLVGYGQEVETDVRPREFLINEETGQSEAKPVAMTIARQAVLNTVAGQENADPLPPLIDAGLIVIATIVLSPTGIVSVAMYEETRLDSVDSNSQRLAAVERFNGRIAPKVDSLESDIAALTSGQAGVVTRETYGRALGRLAVLEARGGIPSSALDSAADFFLDASGMDLAVAGSQVRVEEGIRFADEAQALTQLQIFDPLNPRAKIVGGVMFPAFESERKMALAPASGDVRIAAYSYANHRIVQKTVSRHRIRYGAARTVCTNSAWWQSGRYDAAANIFRVGAETWAVDAGDQARALQDHQFIRVTQFWQDSWEEPYWDRVTVEEIVPGAQVAETFLQPNDAWVTGVGLTFTQLAADGGIALAIVETDRGLPLLDRAVARTTLTRDQLLLNAETVVPVGPVFLTGGKRYAIVVISAADHRLATVQGSVYPQGTFFYVLDGAYQQGDATRDLMFSLHCAKFASARAVVELANLQLAGGITDIDILSPAVIPGSTQLTYEVQIDGRWIPLDRTDGLVLGAGGNLPPNLPLRVVFTGTPDVMPAVTLTGSRAVVSRPRTVFTGTSATRNLPAASTSIRVIARLEYFREADHDFACQLLTGAGFATAVAPSATTDKLTDDGAVERTFVFNLGAGVTAFRKRFTGATNSPLNTFHVAFTKDYAL